MLLSNLNELKNDMVSKNWTICSFLFRYKSVVYIVLVKRFVGKEKRVNQYALVKLHFMKRDDLNDALEIEANSSKLLIDAKTLRQYFGIEYQDNLGDILKQFTETFGKAIPMNIPNNISDEEKGAMVEVFDLGLVKYAIPAYYTIAAAEASSNLERFDGVKYGYRTKEYEGLHNMYKKTRSEGFGAEVKRRIMLGSFVLSSGYYDAYYLKALRTKALIKREFDRVFEKYDLILGPAAPTTAPELGKSLDDPMKMYLGDIYTISVNLAGLPGMSVPVGKDSKGLPVGMQLIGNVFDEKTLIRAAYTYECATKKVHEVPAQIGRTAEKEVQ